MKMLLMLVIMQLRKEVEVVELRGREVGLGVDAVCRYKGKDYRIDIFSLEWLRRKPPGFEWVEAYRAWLGGGGVGVLTRGWRRPARAGTG